MYVARVLSVVAVVCVLTGAARLSAQEKSTEGKPDNKPVEVPGQMNLFKNFEASMKGVKLVGSYSVEGKEDGTPRKEEYVIHSVKKLPVGDFWLINAQLKYGSIDATVPLAMEVKWAGDTPVITLTDFTIPTLGTFSARVLIHEGNYVGTWKHGEAGGLMYGDIVKLEEDKGDK